MYTPEQVSTLVAAATVVTGQRKPTPLALEQLQQVLSHLQPHTLVVIAHEHRHGVSPLAVLVPDGGAPFSEENAKTIAGWEEGDIGVDFVTYAGTDVPVTGDKASPVAPESVDVSPRSASAPSICNALQR